MLEQIYLIDSNPALVAAWTAAFSEWEEVQAIECDYFDIEADAMVSPANSFGYMDGGLDLAIRHELGRHLEEQVQSMILDRHHGEMPVGCAEVVQTGNQRWPYLVCAPTMRVPEKITGSVNAYLAFRAILLSVERHNAGPTPIRSLACPGLGTGIGGLSAAACAEQMRLAYFYLSNPARIPSFQEAHSSHVQLKSK